MLGLDHYAALAISAGNGGSVALLRDDLLHLVAELRAAREVIKHAPRLPYPGSSPRKLIDVEVQYLDALDAYDKVVG